MKSFIVVLFFVSCAFAQMRHGTFIDANGKYWPGSVLVWKRNAEDAKPFADSKGVELLDNLAGAFDKMNEDMIADKPMDPILDLISGVSKSFLEMAKHIPNIPNKPAMVEWMKTKGTDIPAMIENVKQGKDNMKSVSDYMGDAHKTYRLIFLN